MSPVFANLEAAQCKSRSRTKTKLEASTMLMVSQSYLSTYWEEHLVYILGEERTEWEIKHSSKSVANKLKSILRIQAGSSLYIQKP